MILLNKTPNSNQVFAVIIFIICFWVQLYYISNTAQLLLYILDIVLLSGLLGLFIYRQFFIATENIKMTKVEFDKIVSLFSNFKKSEFRITLIKECLVIKCKSDDWAEYREIKIRWIDGDCFIQVQSYSNINLVSTFHMSRDGNELKKVSLFLKGILSNPESENRKASQALLMVFKK